MLENVCEEALSTVLCPSRAQQVGAPHYHLGTLTGSCDNKRTYLGRPSSRWGPIVTCQSPLCAMWGLRAWIQGFKFQLGHSLAGGFVQSLTTSVPVPFPTQLTAPTSQNQDAGCSACSGSQRDVVLTTVIMKMMKAASLCTTEKAWHGPCLLGQPPSQTLGPALQGASGDTQSSPDAPTWG